MQEKNTRISKKIGTFSQFSQRKSTDLRVTVAVLANQKVVKNDLVNSASLSRQEPMTDINFSRKTTDLPLESAESAGKSRENKKEGERKYWNNLSVF